MEFLAKDEEIWNLFRSSRKSDDILFSVEKKIKKIRVHQIEHSMISFSGCRYMYSGNSLMVFDTNWRHGQILVQGEETEISQIICQIFYTHVVQKHFIQMHSSLVDLNGKGILFVGPSGIGKTTQAELWQKYRNARIINGDIVFVQQKEDRFLGWGTPWHGSSPYCINDCVPIVGIVVLKQAKENTLRRLFGFEMIKAISENVFYPLWMENGTELCLATLNDLLTKIPVFELACRPDEEAVSILYHQLFDQ